MKATTEKIKVTVRSEEVKEIEISYPYYTRKNGLWCKFFSINKAIWVADYSFKKQIEYSSSGAPEEWITHEPISEEQFNAKFNAVMTALIEKNNEKTI